MTTNLPTQSLIVTLPTGTLALDTARVHLTDALLNWYGGITVQDARGAWLDDNGNAIEDDSIIVTAYVTQDAHESIADLAQLWQMVITLSGETCLLVVTDGVAQLVYPTLSAIICQTCKRQGLQSIEEAHTLCWASRDGAWLCMQCDEATRIVSGQWLGTPAISDEPGDAWELFNESSARDARRLSAYPTVRIMAEQQEQQEQVPEDRRLLGRVAPDAIPEAKASAEQPINGIIEREAYWLD